MSLLPQGGAVGPGVPRRRISAGPPAADRPRRRSLAAGAGRRRARGAQAAIFAILLSLRPGTLSAAEAVSLAIKDHRFSPDRVSVPAGERFRIEVTNLDDTPEEFESADLKVEKIVVPGGKIAVMAGPLKPGTYKFFGDYHPDTAVGFVTAVERGR